MPKVKLLKDTEGNESLVVFECPACGNWHPFRIATNDGGPTWEWNRDLERPTFSPSLLVYPHQGQPRCHCFVQDGKVIFCGDCEHEMAGQTVELTEIDR